MNNILSFALGSSKDGGLVILGSELLLRGHHENKLRAQVCAKEEEISRHKWWSLKHAMILQNCHLQCVANISDGSVTTNLWRNTTQQLSPLCYHLSESRMHWEECPALLCHPKRIDEVSESQAWRDSNHLSEPESLWVHDTDQNQMNFNRGL